jgi:hypothetical protein
MAGPHEAISPKLMRERVTEQKIRRIYRESPIVSRATGPGPGKKVSYYAPTPAQQEKIIELVKTLPPEKQTKYVEKPIIEEPAPPPKGIAETLAGITIEPVITQIASWITGTPIKKVQQVQKFQTRVSPPPLKPVEPIQFVGGVVASAEAPAYTIGRLVGVKTPRPPPTVVSGALSTVLGDPSEMKQVKQYGPFYAKGTVLGDIILTYVTGKAVTKAWTGAKQIPKLGVVPTKLEKLYIKGVQKLPGPMQRLFISEKTITQRPTAIARQRYLEMKMGRFGYTRTPSLSVRAESWASQTKFTSGIVHTPFEKTFAPSIREVSTRTGSLLLTQKQISRTVTQQVTKQLTFRMVTKPATSQIARQILKTTTQQVVKPITFVGAIPSVFAWTGKQFPHYKLKKSPLTKLLPVTRQYPEKKQKKLDVQIPVSLLKPFEKPKTIPGLDIHVIQTPTLVVELKQSLKTVEKQIQVSQQMVVPVMAKPLRTLTTSIRVGPQRRIRREKRKKRRKGPYGRWFGKTHPIPEPEEMIRRVGL